MSLEHKLDLLERIYRIYDDFAGSLKMACRKHCALCCTANVSLTTIEGYRLVKNANGPQRELLKRRLSRAAGKRPFRPLVTPNRMAALCREGREVPEDTCDPPQKACVLLDDSSCPVYALRPFGCRCFFSQVTCRKGGAAEVPDVVLSVNTVFLQVIEHLDASGCTGSLADVLRCLLSAANRSAYRQDRLTCTAAGLVDNHRLTVLMVPPQHRERLEPIISDLRKLRLETPSP
jgi:Fe-S-cluster containining protein